MVDTTHVMDKVLKQRAVQFIALIIYKLRRHLPGLRIEFSQEDLKEFNSAFHIQQPQVQALNENNMVTIQLVDQRGGALLLARTTSSDYPDIELTKEQAETVVSLADAACTEQQMGEDHAALVEFIFERYPDLKENYEDLASYVG